MSDEFGPSPFGGGALAAYVQKTSLLEFVCEFYEASVRPAPRPRREETSETGVTVSDHPEFLRAIVASPDDDTARLVYADYLDERAELGLDGCESDRARAELIRLQISVARGPDCPVCHKCGFYRGTHGRYCELMKIDVRDTDLDSETIVCYECRECQYKSASDRVRWLLKTKYPVASVNKLAPFKIAGEELWKPAIFTFAREVRYVRGFVGVASVTHSSFLAVAPDFVRQAPLEQIVLCDRVLNRDVTPFGRVGYFWVPDGQELPGEAPGVVLAKTLFDLCATLRDKDSADGVLDCYKWLSWAALYYARRKAELPQWTPRPADATLYPGLKRGMPSYYFEPTGRVTPLTPEAVAIDPWIEQEFRDRKKPYIDYDGFCAYYQEDGFVASPHEPRTVNPLAPI